MGTSIDQPGPKGPVTTITLGPKGPVTTINAGAVEKIVPLPQHFVVLDVETTGLEEDARLLELGMLVCRYTDRWVVDSVVHRVFYYKPAPENPLPLFAAHLTNGLADECERSAEHPWALAKELAKLIPERSIPVGRNVHFDINVLKKHMPALAARFSFRHLDLTTLEMGQERPLRPVSTHRALHDCIQELQALMSCFAPREELRSPL